MIDDNDKILLSLVLLYSWRIVFVLQMFHATFPYIIVWNTYFKPKTILLKVISFIIYLTLELTKKNKRIEKKRKKKFSPVALIIFDLIFRSSAMALLRPHFNFFTNSELFFLASPLSMYYNSLLALIIIIALPSREFYVRITKTVYRITSQFTDFGRRLPRTCRFATYRDFLQPENCLKKWVRKMF